MSHGSPGLQKSIDWLDTVTFSFLAKLQGLYLDKD